MAAPVNVTEVPSQIVPEGSAVMPMLTGRLGVTVMIMVLEVAGFPPAQMVLEVNTQFIKSPFEGT